MNGNSTGTTVSGNTIDAAGSFIKIAVAMGPMPWGCESSNVNYGATVTGNTLTGTHMGYGFVVSGTETPTAISLLASNDKFVTAENEGTGTRCVQAIAVRVQQAGAPSLGRATTSGSR